MIQIGKNEAEYLRSHGVYVSMTNRGKRSRTKRYYLTESAKNLKLHRRYQEVESQKTTERK